MGWEDEAVRIGRFERHEADELCGGFLVLQFIIAGRRRESVNGVGESVCLFLGVGGG